MELVESCSSKNLKLPILTHVFLQRFNRLKDVIQMKSFVSLEHCPKCFRNCPQTWKYLKRVSRGQAVSTRSTAARDRTKGGPTLAVNKTCNKKKKRSELDTWVELRWVWTFWMLLNTGSRLDFLVCENDARINWQCPCIHCCCCPCRAWFWFRLWLACKALKN